MSENDKTELYRKFEIFLNKYLGHWGQLIFSMVRIPFVVIKNPKFVFPFLIIMLISSAGIWAPWAFGIDLSTVCNTTIDKGYISSIDELKSTTFDEFDSAFATSCQYVYHKKILLFQSFSMFMFNVGILGGIAAEFVLLKKSSEECLDEYDGDNRKVREYAAFFVWIISFILSFYGLKDPSQSSYQVNIASWLAISLWICTNYHKKEYKLPNTDPHWFEGGKQVSVEDLKGPGLEGDNLNHDDELNGDGLK